MAGELLSRIYYFNDPDPKHPTAYRAFLKRLQDFHAEYDQWASAIVDSITFMEFAARKNEQYVLNPSPANTSTGTRKGVSFDPRQWWAGSTNECEEVLQGTFGSLPLNVCIIAHIDEDKDEFSGQILRKPKAPGRLSRGLAAGYSEVYHAFVGRAEDGSKAWALQTQPDNTWMCESQVRAPDPCLPDYASLWEEWDRESPSFRPPIHCLVYGDPGSRKSTFAATFPTPLHVFFFDPFGKEMPYLRMGSPSELQVDERYDVYYRDVVAA